MAYGQADDARLNNAIMHKLDGALSVARAALEKIDKAVDLAVAREIALRARVKIAEELK